MSVTHIIYVVCIHEWESICGLQSQLFSENERLFKVSPPPPTGSHIHRKSGSIKEMVQDRHVVTEHH